MKSMYDLLFNNFVNFEKDIPKDFKRLKRTMKYFIDLVSMVLMMCVLLLFSFNIFIAVAFIVFVIGYFSLNYWAYKM